MKPFLVFTLLILSTFLSEGQGINRKLIAKSLSSTISPKNYKNEGDKHDLKMETKSATREKFEISSSPERAKVALPRYQDAVDLAGMDYSPPRRKTPIHN